MKSRAYLFLFSVSLFEIIRKRLNERKGESTKLYKVMQVMRIAAYKKVIGCCWLMVLELSVRFSSDEKKVLECRE